MAGLWRVIVKIQKADEVADFASHLRDIDKIFFESSAKHDFCSEEEKQIFREVSLGRYIVRHRDSFFVALDDARRAVGYLAGCLENPTRLDHFNDIVYFRYIAACKKHKAKLVIAKLDRLSRNLAFIATLMESGVEFVAVDMPEANKLTVHILAAMAEHEREQISKRTRDALAAAKRRGKRLGNPDIAEVAKRGRAALKANARRFAANVRPIIEEIMRSGITSHNAIAAKLNERNVRTARGGTWTHVQVGAILHPFDGANTAAAA